MSNSGIDRESRPDRTGAELVNDVVFNDAKEKKQVKATPVLRVTPMVHSRMVFTQPQVIYVA